MKFSLKLVLLLIVSVVLFNTISVVNAESGGLQVTFTTNPIIIAPGTNGYIEIILKSIAGCQ